MHVCITEISNECILLLVDAVSYTVKMMPQAILFQIDMNDSVMCV